MAFCGCYYWLLHRRLEDNKVYIIFNLIVAIIIGRVSNPNSESMQNKFISVFLSRSTLGMTETASLIGEALEKVCANAILNHKRKSKKRLRDRNYAHRGRSTQPKGKLLLEVFEVCTG